MNIVREPGEPRETRLDDEDQQHGRARDQGQENEKDAELAEHVFHP